MTVYESISLIFQALLFFTALLMYIETKNTKK